MTGVAGSENTRSFAISTDGSGENASKAKSVVELGEVLRDLVAADLDALASRLAKIEERLEQGNPSPQEQPGTVAAADRASSGLVPASPAPPEPDEFLVEWVKGVIAGGYETGRLSWEEIARMILTLPPIRDALRARSVTVTLTGVRSGNEEAELPTRAAPVETLATSKKVANQREQINHLQAVLQRERENYADYVEGVQRMTRFVANALHPNYGPCDGLLADGGCSACNDAILALRRSAQPPVPASESKR